MRKLPPSSHPLPSVEDLRALFSYDSDTGLLTRIAPRRNGSGLIFSDVGKVAGYRHKQNRYWMVKVREKLYRAHRVIWAMVTGAWPEEFIDHIDGDRGNNRWSNLRVVSNAINCQNRKGRTGTHASLLGVSRCRDKWRANIKVGAKRISLGRFATPEEAHEAYLKAKRELHPGCVI